MAPPAATSVYPPGALGPPKDRRGHADSTESRLPAGTEVFSADNHISLGQDIFVDRFPTAMQDRAPRVVFQNDTWNLAFGDKLLLAPAFSGVLMQYDPLPGSSTRDLEERMAQLEADGVTRELAFPNALLGLMGYKDLEVRELCFRIYNEHLAELQERAPGRFYGVGLINWWDGEGARRTVDELKSLGITTFWLPLKAGLTADGRPIDYNSPDLWPVWEAIEESGVPVSHHIGEGLLSAPCATNAYAVSMVFNAAPFREMFGRYVCGGLLDRYPGLRVGWFEGGINWVPSAIQDAEHMTTSFRHLLDTDPEHEPAYYWAHHMHSAFMVDPLGLDLIDRIGADRVMWSSDYPHQESTFGYSRSAIAAVFKACSVEDAQAIVGKTALSVFGME